MASAFTSPGGRRATTSTLNSPAKTPKRASIYGGAIRIMKKSNKQGGSASARKMFGRFSMSSQASFASPLAQSRAWSHTAASHIGNVQIELHVPQNTLTFKIKPHFSSRLFFVLFVFLFLLFLCSAYAGKLSKKHPGQQIGRYQYSCRGNEICATAGSSLYTYRSLHYKSRGRR